MTKYEKLKNLKDSLVQAALRSVNPFFCEMWVKKANEIQEQINKMTVKEAETCLIFTR